MTTPRRRTCSRYAYSRYATRCSPTAVFPVPGAPCTQTVWSAPARTMSILVGLDGGDDIPHGARARPLDLVDEDLARPGSRTMVRTIRAACPGPARGRCPEELILVGGQLAAGEPETPAQRRGSSGPRRWPGRTASTPAPASRSRRACRPARAHACGRCESCAPRCCRRRLFSSGYSSSGISGCGLSGSGLSGPVLAGIVETAEEQRGVGDVFQGFGPVVKLGLEVLLGDRVPAHGPERQHVLAHQPEELTRAPQLIAFGGQDRVTARPFGIMIFFCL